MNTTRSSEGPLRVGSRQPQDIKPSAPKLFWDLLFYYFSFIDQVRLIKITRQRSVLKQAKVKTSSEALSFSFLTNTSPLDHLILGLLYIKLD